MGAIAALLSEVSWRVPLVLIVVYVLAWRLPGDLFRADGIGWGAGSLLYSVVGLLALGVAIYLRRRDFGGPELALAWFGVSGFMALAALSVLTSWGVSFNADLLILGVAVPAAAIFVWLRRAKITGLEFSVYWAGLVLLLFWGMISHLASTTAIAELDARLFAGNGYRIAAMMLSGLFAISAMVILAWRRSKLTRQEITVYGLGLAYLLIASGLLR
jgi:hypothetical protein